MTTDVKKVMMLNTFGIPFPSCICLKLFLLHLNHEMRIFAYYGIMQEDCEGNSCSSTLGEARVSTSRLISVGFCELL